MNLQELNQEIDELREERDAVHKELHAVLADEEQTVAVQKAKVGDLRARISDINESCYPKEVVRGKLQKIVKGVELTETEQAEFERCSALVGEISLV